MSIKRYDLEWDYYGYIMAASSSGDYVKYNDHVAEIAKFETALKVQKAAYEGRIAGLKAALEEYGSHLL